MIDLHSHILPGLDDGARTMEDSLAMARAFVEDGVTSVAATPHVRDDYPTTVTQMEEAVGALRFELARDGIALEVLTGGEIALEHLSRLSVAELRRFGLGGSPAYVLVEFPYFGWPLGMAEALYRLRHEEITPIVAHPERNRDVQSRPDRLEQLVTQGALVQVTAASIDGRLGRRTQRCALELVGTGHAHLVASDAHHPAVREVGLTVAAETIGDADLARWLTVDVPAAIVAQTPLPERPEHGRRRLSGLL